MLVFRSLLSNLLIFLVYRLLSFYSRPLYPSMAEPTSGLIWHFPSEVTLAPFAYSPIELFALWAPLLTVQRA